MRLTNFYRLGFGCTLALWTGASPAAPIAAGLMSPDGQVQLLLLNDEGRLKYDVSFKSRIFIEDSELAMLVDGVNLSRQATPGKPEPYKVEESYPWYGVHATASSKCNGARIPVRHISGVAYTLEMRACNDGVAFRHVIPGVAGKARLPDEATLFRIPAGSTVWYHDGEGHYEAVHGKKAADEVGAGEWAMPPLTFRPPGNAGYGSITEGSLWRYAGMGLQADGHRGFQTRLGHSVPPSYPFRLRYKEDIERMAQPATIAGTITTPWRIIMTGADLNALVNSDLVHAVSPAPDAKLFPKGLNTDWIKPGRAVWKYLDGGENTLEEMKNFTRLASELGFEYHVIEGHWSRWSFDQLKEFVDYSRQRGVGIILWKHSKDLREAKARRAFFEMSARAGVVGAKIDFFDHEAKEVVELYEACLRDAAEFHQVLDFHGANKPTGESRAFPNELTREGIRGMESRRSNRARHDATLPFTRMLAGHADYTPVVFTERRNDTTWAHQIATGAIFTSPMLIYGGHPRSFLDNPAVEVIKSIPSVWDETIALPVSDIGEIAAFARRRGDTWFIAIVNGETARRIELPLTFLPAGSYRALMVRDNVKDPAAVDLERSTVKKEDALQIQLREGGGFIAKLSK